MTLKSGAKFEENLTLGFKNDMWNLVNFNANSGKSENLHFDVLLLSVAYKVSAKNIQKIIPPAYEVSAKKVQNNFSHATEKRS